MLSYCLSSPVQSSPRRRFLRTVPRGRGSHGRLCLRLPWYDNRLRGGIGKRPHRLQGLRPPAAACSELSRVAAVINSRPVIRTGPRVPPGLGLQPLGTARPKPTINFRSLRGTARHAITTTSNYSNFAAARLTSSTQGACVLLSYCLSSPVPSPSLSTSKLRSPGLARAD